MHDGQHARRLRRRAFLVKAGLVAGAAGMATIAPVPLRPTDGVPPVRVRRRLLADRGATLPAGSEQVVDVEGGVVGVRWSGDIGARFALDARAGTAPWRPLVVVGAIDPNEGPDPGSAEAARRSPGLASPPVWVGGASEVRVRVLAGTPRDAALDTIEVPPTPARNGVAAAEPPAPGIISRAAWGADESLRNCFPGYDADVRLAVVHHTVNTNDYGPGDSPGIVRGIYAYHTRSLGYCDIAYNFLIDRYGAVFEGRVGGVDAPVHGAHAGGFNTDSTGIALIGTFDGAGPTRAALDALGALLAWKLTLHRVPLDRPVVYVTTGNDKFPAGSTVALDPIVGHRDTGFTACPGNVLWDFLPGIRAEVAARVVTGSAGGRWREWEPLGGSLTSGPAVASWASGRLDVFSRSTDTAMWHRWFDGTAWRGWESLGGDLTSDPAAVSDSWNRVHAFARSADNGLWHRWWDGGAWRGWEPLGGSLTSGPGVASPLPDRLHVFVRGGDSQLWHRWWDGVAWRGWEPLGGTLTSDPAAVSDSWNRIHVFARGTDNQLWHQWFDGAHWRGWEPLGGSLASGPGAASPAPDRLHVFVRGGDSQLWHRWWDGVAWRGWEPLGGTLTSDPAAVSDSWNRIHVFARGTDNQLWHRWFG